MNGLKAAHETRMQLSSIACDRELTKEETLLQQTASRLLNLYFSLAEEELRNENTSRLSAAIEEEVPPGEEPGLLSTD